MTTTMRRTRTCGTIPGIRNGIQKEIPINNGVDKKLVRFFNNHSLESLQLPHRQWAVSTRSGP
eukprot:3462341-Amphidinium_carterae.4